jgi:prepilin signal peptidase PulO-like enzyme (type II secretory pathway)
MIGGDTVGNNTGAWIVFIIFVALGLSVISPLIGKIVGWSIIILLVGFVVFYHFIWDTNFRRQWERRRKHKNM